VSGYVTCPDLHGRAGSRIVIALVTIGVFFAVAWLLTA
jgi:hypothetical protein